MAGAKFCQECGAQLAASCPGCAAAVAAGQTFCAGCGARLASDTVPGFTSPQGYTPPHLAERILKERAALEGERKQVTVLFADVSGFTRLSERLDPEEVRTAPSGRPIRTVDGGKVIDGVIT